MHVQSLTLHNVRQFAEHELSLRPGFNLLVGVNGAGKTTLLRCLAVLLRANRHSTNRPTLNDDDIRLRANEMRVTALVSDGRPEPWTLTYHKRLWESPHRFGAQKDRLVVMYSSNESVCRSFASRKIKRFGATSEADELRRSEEGLFELDMPEFSRGGNERAFGNSRLIRSFTARILGNFAERFRRFYWRFEPYDCFIRGPKNANQPSVPTPGLHSKVRAAVMRRIHETRREQHRAYLWPNRREVVFDSDGVNRSEPERELPRNPAILEALKIAEISQKDSSYLRTCEIVMRLTPRIIIQTELGPLRLNQLSDGEQRLFSLFVDIARQLSVQHPHIEPGNGTAIVLIDEIDVHLHPKWQRKVVPALEDLFPQCQFIATTHSPFIIQQVDRAKIKPLGRNRPVPMSENNSIEDIVEDIQDVPMPQRSVRAERLSEAAENYFKLLKRRGTTSSGQLREAEMKYREASKPFTSQPALNALLEIELLENR